VWFLNVTVTVRAVVTRIVSNVPISEFKNLGSNLIKSEAETRNLHTGCHPGANDVIVGERGVLTVIAPYRDVPLRQSAKD
jgi:hypothetical protein